MDVRSLVPVPIAELQRELELSSYASLWQVLAGVKQCSPGLAIRIEKATKGAIPRHMLRPDLWTSTDHRDLPAAS